MTELGFNSGGTIRPRIKYNSKAGRAYRVEREQDKDGDWVSKDVEVTDNLCFLLDRRSMRKGWMNFKTFHEVIVPIKADLPEQPDDIGSDGKLSYKPVLKMTVKLAPNCGGDIREFSTSSMLVMNSIGDLLVDWKSSEHSDDDMCPVIKLVGSEAISGNHGVNYKPTWEVSAWRERPADMAPKEPQDEDLSDDEPPKEIPSEDFSNQGEPPSNFSSANDPDDDLPF